MKRMWCTLCPNRMTHGFPYKYGSEQHLLCGDCMRRMDEGKTPKRLTRKSKLQGSLLPRPTRD